MGKFGETFEDLMVALSFAEAGEVKTARQMLHREQRVLLAINRGTVKPNVLKYAVSMCRRVEADLDILVPSSVCDSLEGKLAALVHEGIQYRIIHSEGALRDEIIAYTAKSTQILFVVIDASEELHFEQKAKGKNAMTMLQRLGCPLVIVSEGHEVA